MTSIEMRKDRAKLLEQAGEILTKVNADGRKTMTTEEEASFDKMHADGDLLLRQIEKIEKHEAAQKAAAESLLATRGTVDPDADPDDDDPSDELRAMRAKKRDRLERTAFRSWCYGGWGAVPENLREIANRHKPSGAMLKDSGVDEFRATGANPQTVTTTAGGYLIPRGYQAEIDKAMLAFGGVRQACRILTTAIGNTLDWPSVDDTAIKGRLLSINTGVTTTGFTVGTVTFAAYKFSSDIVLVPSELMQDATFGENFDTFLRDMLAERLGRITNDYFTTGTGSSQPQGIVAGATASGIGGFDLSDLTLVSTANTWYPMLVALVHSVDPAYRPGAAFMMHDTMLRDLRKVVDTTGRPIIQSSALASEPDTALGYPVTINQSMANTGTNANIPIIFGAMKKFVVREVRPMVLLRLVERYADSDQTGFVAFSREDSHLLDAGTHPIKSATVVT